LSAYATNRNLSLVRAYRATPSAQAKGSLKARFDRILSRSFGFDDLDQALVRLKARKSELLVVLDRPEVPLNTNISEQEIRDPVTLRKISGGTHSEDGRRCRDTFLSLKKTCQKNAISFWAYLGDGNDSFRRFTQAPGEGSTAALRPRPRLFPVAVRLEARWVAALECGQSRGYSCRSG